MFIRVGLGAQAMWGAQAQPQTRRQPDRTPEPAVQAPERHSSAAILGFEFRESLIVEAVILVEKGKTQEAIDVLNTALADRSVKSPERDKELRAGMGLVYLRSGDLPKARQFLNPYTRLDDGAGGLGARCKALTLAADRVSKLAKDQSGKLRDREYWKMEVLAPTRRDLEKKFRDHHERVSQDIESQSWSRISGDAESAAEFAVWMDVIVPRDEGSIADPIPEHAQLLKSEVQRIEDRARSLRDKGNALRGEIDSLSGAKEKGVRNSRIDQYNYVRTDVSSAGKAARALIADYEKFRGRYPKQIKAAAPRYTVSDLPEVFR